MIFLAVIALWETMEKRNARQEKRNEKTELAAIARSLEQRRLEGIKARILSPVRPSLVQPPDPTDRARAKRVAPLRRAAAHNTFAELERAIPIGVVTGPKVSRGKLQYFSAARFLCAAVRVSLFLSCLCCAGSRYLVQGCGKSTAARLFAADSANPHAIYVDLHGCTSFDGAARRVADAIGYDTAYTTEEQLAKQAGFKVQDLNASWGPDQYDRLLQLFMTACLELMKAGKLQGGHVPVLLLDHASRPFGDSKRASVNIDAAPPAPVAAADPSARRNDTLIYQTLESTKLSDLATNRQCRFVFITSGTTSERDIWQRE